jgi:hypothetical protein
VTGGPVVRLDGAQQAAALAVAAARQGTAPARQAHGCADGLAEHELGALGEAAFAVWAGHPLELTCGTYRSAPDFPGTEVRTRSRAHWDLIVRGDDDIRCAYVLVVPFGSLGVSWRLPGWLWGREAGEAGIMATYGGRERAWFVPQSRLRPMGSWHADGPPTRAGHRVLRRGLADGGAEIPVKVAAQGGVRAGSVV